VGTGSGACDCTQRASDTVSQARLKQRKLLSVCNRTRGCHHGAFADELVHRNLAAEHGRHVSAPTARIERSLGKGGFEDSVPQSIAHCRMLAQISTSHRRDYKALF
jgi:hypothetical protein